MRSLSLIYSIGNFLILVLLLRLFLGKRIKNFLLGRRENYIARKAEAQSLYKTSLEKLEAVRLKLRIIDDEGKSYLDNVLEKSKKEAALNLKKAMNVREQIVLSRQRAMDADTKDLKKLIRLRLVTKVLEKTQDRIRESSPKGLTDMYIEEYSDLSNTEVGAE